MTGSRPGRTLTADVTQPRTARNGFDVFRQEWETQTGAALPLPAFDVGETGDFRIDVQAANLHDAVIADVYSERFLGRPAAARACDDRVLVHLMRHGSWRYGLSQVEGAVGYADAKVLLPLIGGLVLIGGFTAWALTRTTTAAVLIDLRLFRYRAVSSSTTLLFLGGISLYGSMMLLPSYFQQVRGQDALGAGLLLIPQGAGALLARGLAGKYTDRFGPRGVALAAFAFLAATTVPFAFVTADTSEILLTAALFVRGIALGAAMIAPMGAAYVGLQHDEIPDAGIISRVTQQLGGSVGIAVLAVVLQHGTCDAHTPDALAQGFDQAFWWAVAFTALALPLCLLLPGHTQPVNPDRAESEAAVEA
ncbi:MFS transporter [Streptomyces ureilyticus]|nr:MFS transporter [Streptomyces ureilyticus]